MQTRRQRRRAVFALLPPTSTRRREMTAFGPWLPTCALRQVGSYLKYTGHQINVVVTPARGPMRSIQNRLTLTMPWRGTEQCGSANPSEPLTNGGRPIGMAGRRQAVCSVAERGQFLSEANTR
jgi:hypothetical protein